MKPEYDFAKGERGKFFQAGATLVPGAGGSPLSLGARGSAEDDAQRTGQRLLKKNIALIKAAKEHRAQSSRIRWR